MRFKQRCHDAIRDSTLVFPNVQFNDVTGSSHEGCFLSEATFPISRYYRVYTLCIRCTLYASRFRARPVSREPPLTCGRPDNLVSTGSDGFSTGGWGWRGEKKGNIGAWGSLIKVSNNGRRPCISCYRRGRWLSDDDISRVWLILLYIVSGAE